MRRNGESAALVNHFANFARRSSLQVRKFCADTKKMAIGSGDFDARENKKVIDRLAIEPHQAFLEQIVDRIARVVIGDGEPMQTFGPGARDQIFRTGNTVAGKERVRVQVDIERHFWQANLTQAKRKASG